MVDVRQIFNASVVGLMPHFAGAWTGRILGNWELSAIAGKRTGFWFNASSGVDNSLSGVGADRPNVVADAHLSNPSLNQWFNTAAFKANATERSAIRDATICSTLTSSNFGKILGANEPRIMQFALKYIF